MEKFLKVLIAIAVVLGASVLALIVLAVLQKPAAQEASNKTHFEMTPPQPINSGVKILFSDIGTLRALSKDKHTIVLAPYFEYYENDLPFQEELVKKKVALRKSILDFFAKRKISEIREMGEEEIKSRILELVNSRLNLNQIDTMYFENYLILD